MSMAGSASPGLQLAAGSPASMLHAAFSPRASSPLVDPQGGAHTLTPTHKPSISSHPVQRIETQEGGPAEAQGLPGVPHRGPSPFSSGPQVWAENGGMEALVGGTYPGGRGGSVEERGALPGGGVPGVRSLPLAPSDTLVCLPPQRRAQLVLREMAGMARRLLDLAQGTPWATPHPFSFSPLLVLYPSPPPPFIFYRCSLLSSSTVFCSIVHQHSAPQHRAVLHSEQYCTPHCGPVCCLTLDPGPVCCLMYYLLRPCTVTSTIPATFGVSEHIHYSS